MTLFELLTLFLLTLILAGQERTDGHPYRAAAWSWVGLFLAALAAGQFIKEFL